MHRTALTRKVQFHLSHTIRDIPKTIIIITITDLGIGIHHTIINIMDGGITIGVRGGTIMALVPIIIIILLQAEDLHHLQSHNHGGILGGENFPIRRVDQAGCRYIPRRPSSMSNRLLPRNGIKTIKANARSLGISSGATTTMMTRTNGGGNP